MIHCKEFSGRDLDDVLKEVSKTINDDKIINIQEKKTVNRCEGYDEYDSYIDEYYYLKVFYKD